LLPRLTAATILSGAAVHAKGVALRACGKRSFGPALPLGVELARVGGLPNKTMATVLADKMALPFIAGDCHGGMV
jgi:hypothetical protein